MSVQAGIWNFDGRPVDRVLLESYSQRLSKFGPDGENVLLNGAIGLLYRPFHTTSDSRLERQPHVSPAGNVITWDGRLDNREQLAALLAGWPSTAMTDVDVVAACFDRWGCECFAKFIGDWAFAGWNPKEQTLTLAIDYMAIKHLYYHVQSDHIAWCSDLETLVLQSGDKFDLDDEYIAGYFAYNPAPGRTPYLQIRSVEPGHFVQSRNGHAVSSSYWKFNPKLRIHYKTDAEYEEHFRDVFRKAVRRRLRSDAPILADLSGGLDSSSIVCMADDILSREGAETPRLDTYSHYDLGEPDGDDLQYLRIVEQKRGRTGNHLDIAKYGNSLLPDLNSFSVAPGGIGGAPDLEAEQARIWRSGGYKVALSGVGGDEMLGGVPNPSPQLADLIVQGRLIQFISQTAAWSLRKKKPWLHVALRAGALLPPAAIRALLTRECAPAPWLDSAFASRFQVRVRQLGPLDRYGFWLPSRQECARTVVALSRLQASHMECSGVEERRYPYFDQDLVQFLLSIPRDQVIRLGERRSLMRRALKGLVPDEILSRRTKGTAARRPLLAVANDWKELDRLFDYSFAAQWGYINESKFRNTLLAAKNGDSPQLLRLLRTLSLEFWLRGVVSHGVIRLPQVRPPQARNRLSVTATAEQPATLERTFGIKPRTHQERTS
jgi:asparagine synthase (glutamine-hydrolysing)